MHMFSNLKNFLYDNDNFIAILNKKIYLYNISKIDIVKQDLMVVFFDKKKIEIKGSNLKPIKCIKKEILIEGFIESVTFYE